MCSCVCLSHLCLFVPVCLFVCVCVCACVRVCVHVHEMSLLLTFRMVVNQLMAEQCQNLLL